MSEKLKSQESPTLMPTIPTVVGMIINNGNPRNRRVPPNLSDCDLNLATNSTKSASFKIPDEIVNYNYNYKTKQASCSLVEFFYECISHRILPMQIEDDNKNENENKNDNKSTWSWISCTFSSIFNSKYVENYDKTNIISRLFGNIYACTRQNISCNDLKKYIVSNKRIDIEQCVGLIISLLNKDKNKYGALINKLLMECKSILFDCCMWLHEQHDISNGLTKNEIKYKRFIDKFNNYYINNNEINININTKINNLNEMNILLDILRRIRHSNSKKSNKSQRCLRIPDILYEYIGINKPKEDEYDNNNSIFSWPERDDIDIDVIYIGRRRFNRLNRQLRCLEGKFGIGAELRRKIWKLRDKMKCRNINDINNTNDILSLCFSFISFQRHCQLKIVSNLQSDAFLKKGQSKTWIQNNPQQITTFENVLINAALKQDKNVLDLKALTAVITPHQVFEYKDNDNYQEGKENKLLDIGWKWEEYVKYIDDTALLMEQYVLIHGNGKFDNLCFKKGINGGSRGPVDDYNLLCDIMKSYIKRYKDGIKQFEMNYKNDLKYLKNDNYGYQYIFNHLPEKNDKFLAKDIMAWNNAWNDDVFSNKKKPDWIKWLQFRRNNGAISPSKKQCY